MSKLHINLSDVEVLHAQVANKYKNTIQSVVLKTYLDCRSQ